MLLSEIAASLEGAGIPVLEARRAASPVSISGLRTDSRTVRRGDLFAAWRGSAADGHGFVRAAWKAGAAAALVERFVRDAPLPQLRVQNARRSAALAARALTGDPAARLKTAAITGTNGKTTTALMARAILSARAPSAAIGTLGVVEPSGDAVSKDPSGLTTPGAAELLETLARLQSRGAENVVVEASSHALDQYRLDGARFDVAAFTNLTRDHLDYHGTMKRYLRAKTRLLELLKPCGRTVVHAADPAWMELDPPGVVVRAGIDGEAPESLEVAARDVRTDLRGCDFELEAAGSRARVRMKLLGRFNVRNAAVATAVGLALGSSLEDATEALNALPPISGRMEPIDGIARTVLIDFAHTPDALQNALKTLKHLASSSGRVICVFGAGGDRDRGKRPEMGRIVSRIADIAVATSDNPRSENPERILDDVVQGMDCAAGSARLLRIVDRRDAIQRAVQEAGPKDVVLLAGKGGETTQMIGDEALPFDEKRIVRSFLAERGMSA